MPVPLDRSKVVVPAILAVAAIALVGPWRGDGIASGVAAAAVLAAFGLTCWTAGRARDATGPETSALDWQPLLDRLDRIASALESRPAAPASIDGLATISRAIAEGRWADAEAMLAEHPGHPDAARYAAEVASARQAAGEALRDELKAAQEVSDPDRVLEIHAGLAAVLTAEALAEVEAQVSKWLLALIMRRLRGGTVRPDVAELAAKVAERFPRSVEGASLRASLGTLRRSAGLCPRCARPYRGIADACPTCLAPAPASAPAEAGGNGSTSAWRVDPAPADDPPAGAGSDGPSYPEFLDDPT